MNGALTCVVRWSIGKTSLNDIAHEAGCARQTVYNYYGSRDGVVLAALLELPKELYLQMLTDTELSPLANQEVFNSELCLGLITQVARVFLKDTPELLDQTQEIGEVMTRILLSLLLIQGPTQRSPEEQRALIRKRFLPGLVGV